jgi:hypothetical protein
MGVQVTTTRKPAEGGPTTYAHPVRHPHRLSWVAAGALVALTACYGSSSDSIPASLPGRHLTRAHFNSGAIGGGTNIWPLSADSGTLSCVEVEQHGKKDFAVVFTTEDGTQYALNGIAENTGRYHPGHEIYLPGVYNPQPSPNATSLIGYGLRLCPHYRPRW